MSKTNEKEDRDTILARRRTNCGFTQLGMALLQLVALAVFAPYRITQPLLQLSGDIDYRTATCHQASLSLQIIGFILYFVCALVGLFLAKKDKTSPQGCIDLCEVCCVVAVFVSVTNIVLNVAVAQYLPQPEVVGSYKQFIILVSCLAVSSGVALVELVVVVIQLISMLNLRRTGGIVQIIKMAASIKGENNVEENGNLQSQDVLAKEVEDDGFPEVVFPPMKKAELKSKIDMKQQEG